MCAVYANILRGGSNSFQTGADDFSEFMYWTMSDGIPPIGTIAAGTPVTGDFAVQAQGTPNKTVAVKAGKILIKATPTSESERLFTVTLSADHNVTITDNTSGSTKYDVIYVTLPAASLHDPAATGDLTEAACIGAERHTAAGVALTVTNAIAIAEVTVANGFSSITNANIADKRKYAQSYGPMDWHPILGTISCGSTNVITVPAGALKRVSVGDKIWCKDDGVEFMGYATAVADTTISVKGGSTAGVGADIASSSVITELYYSKAPSPIGHPEHFTFTLNTYANDSTTGLTETVNLARFWMKGLIKYFEINVDPISNPGGTKIYIDLPIAATSIDKARYIGSAYIESNNAAGNGYAMIPASVTAKAAVYMNGEATWSASGNEAIIGTFSYI